MEKGKVSSLSGYNSGGMIADGQGGTINFSNGDIVNKDRNQIKTGDQVWFERVGAHAGLKAINIRRC